MAEDRIGVRQYSVSAVRNHPNIETRALQRLEVMQKELAHLQGALFRLKAALTTRSAPTASLASGVMDSRNWTVSLVMSHAYIQRMVAGDELINGHPIQNINQVEKLAARAGALGEGDAGKELAQLNPRIREAIRQSNALGGGKPPLLLPR